MNRTYSIQIKHHRTGLWTHNTSVVTNSSAEEVQQQYEKEYNRPVRAVQVTESQLEAIQDQMFNSF